MAINTKRKIFGRWRVVDTETNDNRFWLCKCLCGTQRNVRYQALFYGISKSCGCLHKELASKANKTHGESKTRLYSIWSGIKKRIFDKKNQDYHNYGGRGITLSKRWLKYESFKKWAIKNGYKDNLSIERKNFNQGYASSNCIWIPMNAQWINRRGLIKYKGENQKHAGLRLGGSPTLVRDRINRLSWSKKKAYTTPLSL